MFDRLLNSALWLTVMGMISISGGAALLLGYRGLFSLCAGHYNTGAISVAIGTGLAGGTYLLCRHCNDLMDR